MTFSMIDTHTGCVLWTNGSVQGREMPKFPAGRRRGEAPWEGAEIRRRGEAPREGAEIRHRGEAPRGGAEGRRRGSAPRVGIDLGDASEVEAAPEGRAAGLFVF